MNAGAEVFLAVGANIAPLENIPRALELLLVELEVSASSTFYWSAPLGRVDQPDFLNGMWRLRTTLAPRALKFEVLRPIEAALGRVRGEDRCLPRPIDLDIALFDDLVLEEPGLKIPDPEIRSRAFLAVPLRELAPSLILPDSGETLADLAVAAPTPELEPHPLLTRRLRERIESFQRQRTTR